MSRYGPTIDLHMDTLTFIWCPLINIVVLAATFPYYKAAVYFHGIGSFLISLYTIIITVPILLVSGIIQDDNHKHHEKRIHQLIGIGCLLVILIQIILGTLCRLSNLLPSDSKLVLNIRRIHQIFGLLTILFQKFQILRFIKEDQRNKYAILELVAIVIYIYRKNFSSRMEASPEIPQNSRKKEIILKPIKSLQELTAINPTKDYAVFGNKVYDLSPLKQWHPAGYQIIQSLKNSEFDRFIFGIYGPHLYPSIPRYSHSENILNLLDQPIAEITIPSCYDSISESKSFQIAQLRLVSEKSHIYEMYLKGQNNHRFHQYRHIEQLGRFYSLTLNGKITRLYTCVNFIHTQHVEFLKKHIKDQEVQNYSKNSKDHDGQIPLFFKHYEDGRMTSALVKGGAKELKLSEQKGQGLRFENLQQGKVIIIAGGTGIYPFSDLIDLLYKNTLLKKRPELKQELQSLNPLLKTQFCQKYTFKILASFDKIEQLHPITKHQLLFIAEYGNNLSLSLRIKEPINISWKNVTKIEERFQILLEKELLQKNISKIIICGPPRMNQSLNNLLKLKEIPSKKYLIL